jgi:hypothetical protein
VEVSSLVGVGVECERSSERTGNGSVFGFELAVWVTRVIIRKSAVKIVSGLCACRCRLECWCDGGNQCERGDENLKCKVLGMQG